jgi:hypothetical protein
MGIDTPNSITPMATNMLPIDSPTPSGHFFEPEITITPNAVVKAESE